MIARFFKEIGWVDELGSGIRNIFKYASLYTPNSQPVFIENDLFKTIIPLVAKTMEETTQKTTQKTTQETTQKTEDIIIELLQRNPEYGRVQIAEILENITEDGVKYHLDKLKKAGKIKHIGPNKGGYWQVVEI
jgi:ATP-dependent DNA helicase RecG